MSNAPKVPAGILGDPSTSNGKSEVNSNPSEIKMPTLALESPPPPTVHASPAPVNPPASPPPNPTQNGLSSAPNGVTSPKSPSALLVTRTTGASALGRGSVITNLPITITPALTTTTNLSPPTTVAPVAPASQLVKTGILTKLGANLLHKWRTRFFVLKNDSFTYYPSQLDYESGKVKALGSMIVDVNLHCWSEHPNDLEWKFISTEKTVVVRSTLPEKRDWYDAIEKLVTQLKSNAAVSEGKDPNLLSVTSNSGRPISPSTTPRSSNVIISSVYNYSNEPSSTVAEEDDIFTASRESDPAVGNERSRVKTLSTDSTESTSSMPPLKSSASFNNNSNGPTLPPSSSSASISAVTEIPLHERAQFVAKRELKSFKAQELFGWPKTELLIKDFSCAVEKTIMLHGRMYITQNFIGFFSPLFNSVKLCIPIDDIISVCEANQAIIFPNAIRIFVRAPTAPPPALSPPATSTSEDGITSPPSNKAAQILGLASPTSSTSSASSTPAAVAPATPAATATPTAQQIATSYFFGSFGVGQRAKCFQLITSLINETYNPADYYMDIIAPPTTASDSSSKSGGTTADTRARSDSNVSDSVGSSAEDASTIEDDDDVDEEGDEGEDTIPELGTGGTTRGQSHLEFGVHRASMSHDNRVSVIDFKEMLSEDFPELSARAFWKMFVSDAALYTAEHYHTGKGDTEYAASVWKDAKLVEGASGADGTWEFVRDTMVRVPVLGSPMGPDSTRVLKVQKHKFESLPSGGTRIQMETVAVTPDVPFGDCFHLVDQWTIEDQPGTGGCKLSIKLGINIFKSNWKLKAIKSMLITRALGDNQKGFEQYIAGMKKWISTHPKEVEAVKKVVSKSTPAKSKLVKESPAANAPKSDASASSESTDSNSAAFQSRVPSFSTTAVPPAPKFVTFGVAPLDALIQRLPPSIGQNETKLKQIGMGLGGVLVLFLSYLLFFSGSSSSMTTSTLPAASSATPPVSPSSATSVVTESSSGGSWLTTVLILLLFSLVVLLGSKVYTLEQELHKMQRKKK